MLALITSVSIRCTGSTGMRAGSLPMQQGGEEVKKVLKRVHFHYEPVIGGVRNVSLAGTFNEWKPSETPMLDEDGDGIYETIVELPVGRYQYKFVVDGNWITDPHAQDFTDDNRGGKNALITVDETFEDAAHMKGDRIMALDDIPLQVDYSMVNPLDQDSIEFNTRAYREDVRSVTLIWCKEGSPEQSTPMISNGTDNVYEYFRAVLFVPVATPLFFTFRYEDGGESMYAAAGRFVKEKPKTAEMFFYDPSKLRPFYTPEWAKRGIFYQIFTDRFCNGDRSLDPDFHEVWYGDNTLPPGGKTNGEYFHLVEDWNDVEGLIKSPYRTDGRPDYYSFYGGDIPGVMQKLPYLEALGVTILYFNPLNIAKSNHKYDAIDYLKIDPHFADESMFRAFVREAHRLGIRIIVDMAFNHTGDWHFAFRDTREKGPKSKYWNWYEWKTWPIPEGPMPEFCDYYSCWWGFSLHPNLDYDLSRPNELENDIENIEEAKPNWDVVHYVLETVHYWLGVLDIDGFRLDVPNEVPFWFWKEFRKVVDEVKPDALLVGEIWGNAMPWMGPHCFHSTMNYKYFKDPVIRFFAQRMTDAETFDRELAPGRKLYPIQATEVMMNLIGSHDTIRFFELADKDERRMMLAALFQMTYIGTPHIYYGDEVGLEGGKDPDNRRPFPWNWESDPRSKRMHDFYSQVTMLRHRHPALSLGRFIPVLAKGRIYAYLRQDEKEKILVILNNETGVQDVQIDLGPFGFKKPLEDLLHPRKYTLKKNKLSIRMEGLSGSVLQELR